MHNRPALKTTWYEKLAWNVCPWIYYKIRGIRERRAEERERQRIFKMLNEAFLEISDQIRDQILESLL